MSKEHFTLFSGGMVRAILGGIKSQTRRMVACSNSTVDGVSARSKVGRALWERMDFSQAEVRTKTLLKEVLLGAEAAPVDVHLRVPCPEDGSWHRVRPYVRMGDRMLVKETFKVNEPPSGWIYRATDETTLDPRDRRTWTPSILMPREAVRLRLDVTGVRVERLQEISEEDAWAEGCKRGRATDNCGWFPADEPDPSGTSVRGWDCARDWYADLWNSINDEAGKRWEDNPWVWVREFCRA